jgi:hypothetical protein
MRRLVIVALTVVTLGLAGGVAWAGDSVDYRNSDVTEDHYVDGFSHPLRIAAYAIAPVGYAAEWLIFRPFHYIISRPQVSKAFNYRNDEDVDIRF